MSQIFIGQAGWSIRSEFADDFPVDGSHLERYARRLDGVEINSSFYRPHQPKTYARWAESVPERFRFAVKTPQLITHALKLRGALGALQDFLLQTSHLGEKRGPLLFQLPPSLAFDEATARAFFEGLRERYAGPAVCEPRHMTWFGDAADALLKELSIARAAADPARVPAAREPGGDRRLVYYRWHGSPRMYYSTYPPAELESLRRKLLAASAQAEAWCIFDNTTVGAATGNALALFDQLALESAKM